MLWLNCTLMFKVFKRLTKQAGSTDYILDHKWYISNHYDNKFSFYYRFSNFFYWKFYIIEIWCSWEKQFNYVKNIDNLFPTKIIKWTRPKLWKHGNVTALSLSLSPSLSPLPLPYFSFSLPLLCKRKAKSA